MSYFLKKTKTRKGIYYQVYDGVHNPEKGYATQKSVRVIGYHDDLLRQGHSDPSAYAKGIVEEMRKKRREEMEATVDDGPDTRNLGHFLPDAVLKKIDIRKDMNLFNGRSKVRYDLYSVFRFLVLAQMVRPSSKLDEYATLKDQFFAAPGASYSQILDALSELGNDYKSIITLINLKLDRFHRRDTTSVYFDCTNFYFEIDRPYGDKQKGPSKEKRTDPIIGMALLLDAAQLPLSMEMYPGNQSEKPYIRKLIDSMKADQDIKGRTIQVADKGLNCGQNIFKAISHNDGYIYSQSVKQLPEVEKEWVLFDRFYEETRDASGQVVFKIKEQVDDFTYKFTCGGRQYSKRFRQKRIVYWSKRLFDKQTAEINSMVDKALRLGNGQAKRTEYGDSAKYIDFVAADADGVAAEVRPVLKQSKIDEDLSLCGYNMLITSEVDVPKEEICSIYRRLWRIEECFRILKTDLLARPVYLQKREAVYGHFLVCYVALLVLRYLEIHEYRDEIPMSRLIRFIREYEAVQNDGYCINLSGRSLFPRQILDKTKLPLTKKVLTPKMLEAILNYKI